MCVNVLETSASSVFQYFNILLQEQPLLLEDLLEQEKREQARHTSASQLDQIMPNPNQQSILSDQVK